MRAKVEILVCGRDKINPNSVQKYDVITVQFAPANWGRGDLTGNHVVLTEIDTPYGEDCKYFRCSMCEYFDSDWCELQKIQTRIDDEDDYSLIGKSKKFHIDVFDETSGDFINTIENENPTSEFIDLLEVQSRLDYVRRYKLNKSLISRKI